MTFSGLPFLGSNYNHTCHGTCTINRSRRSILQNLETLNIICIQTCNGRTNQCNGVTRRQLIGTYFRNIFHYDTINYPQRFRTTINRCSTTNTYFRSCTESSGNILYRYTCRTSLQRTANICQTIQFHIFTGQFGRSTCKKSFIHLCHTGNHYFFQNFSIRFHHDFHRPAFYIHLYRLHADVGYSQYFCRTRHISKCKLTIEICYRPLVCTFNQNRCTYNRLIVFFKND